MNTHLIRTELRLFRRDPAAIFFALVMPVVILIILGCIPSFRAADPDIGGQRVIDLYVPILMALAVTMVALSILPTTLVTYRERGVLRRFATTPVRPRDVLMAQLVVHLIIMLAGIVLLVLLGRIAFGVPFAAAPVAFVVAVASVIAALFGIGLLLASAVRRARLAAGLGSLLFFPMLFFAGLWVPREAMPALLRGISDATPLGAGVQAIRDASLGHWPALWIFGVLAGYAVVTWLAALRLFRWQ